MKFLGRFTASAAASVLALLGVATTSQAKSVSGIDAAWSQALKNNKLEGYAEFLMMHPESQYTNIAYEKLSTLDTSAAEFDIWQSANETADRKSQQSDSKNVSPFLYII